MDSQEEEKAKAVSSSNTDDTPKVQVAFRKNRRPNAASSSSLTNSLRSSMIRHTKTEEEIFTPNLHVSPSLRNSLSSKVPENSIRNSSIDSASTFIRQFTSLKSDDLDEASIIDAAIEDKKTSELVASHKEDSDSPVVAEKEESGPIASVSEDQDDSDLESNLNPVIIIKNLPPYNSLPKEIRQRVLLPPKSAHAPKYTLVLDLDETLVHCSMEHNSSADLTFSIRYEGQRFVIYANVRPFLFYLLKRVAPFYEIIIYTASQRCYADRLLNIIDSEQHLIDHRLYREDCLYIDGNYVKDLNALNRDLSKTVIVDNYICCFGYHLENGIPIISWFNDKSDHELYNLSTVLLSFVKHDDIRPQIESLFHLKEILSSFDIACMCLSQTVL